MNLVIDSGNTFIKAALFEGDKLIRKEIFQQADLAKQFVQSAKVENMIVSTVNLDASEILSWAVEAKIKLVLTSELALPVKIDYATPHTLGVDRIAAVCGALEMFPNEDCLVIDSGTCITYEILEKTGVYRGGAISPGISMRFNAMHKFTRRLPLIELKQTSVDFPFIGNSTETCMISGVINGACEELNGMIAQYRAIYPDLKVIICGGDYSLFENKVKHPIFVAPEIVLQGLNRILRYHVSI